MNNALTNIALFICNFALFTYWFKKADAGAHPVLALVVAYTDHFAFAHPHEVVDEARLIPFFVPEDHHADFAFGRFRRVGGFDTGHVIHFALEDEVAGIVHVFHVFAGDVDFYALAGKRKERFEHPVFEVVGDGFSVH